ncbi:hypothetical protein CC86DRAFT_405652 [Ophiobolus disseminans]|uniref:Uncharacterized protein n=1 Tax=Ophiobolus disseminans TaxID=1469910 RepID=A0A6A7A2I1_9PLEO|nr:hypothetical protein CC86DRAFT_405652 [Ophiobolus disseminans]
MPQMYKLIIQDEGLDMSPTPYRAPEEDPCDSIDSSNHPSSPQLHELKAATSEWINQAGKDTVPDLLVLTLDERYTGDLSNCPNFKGNDLSRVQALCSIAEDLGMELYYTILSFQVVSTYDLSEPDVSDDVEVELTYRALEPLIPLFNCDESIFRSRFAVSQVATSTQNQATLFS